MTIVRLMTFLICIAGALLSLLASNWAAAGFAVVAALLALRNPLATAPGQ